LLGKYSKTKRYAIQDFSYLPSTTAVAACSLLQAIQPGQAYRLVLDASATLQSLDVEVMAYTLPTRVARLFQHVCSNALSEDDSAYIQTHVGELNACLDRLYLRQLALHVEIDHVQPWSVVDMAIFHPVQDREVGRLQALLHYHIQQQQQASNQPGSGDGDIMQLVHKASYLSGNEVMDEVPVVMPNVQMLKDDIYIQIQVCTVLSCMLPMAMIACCCVH
jgi:hypothetical protein